MVHPLKILALSFCVISMSVFSVQARETTTVTAEGVAAIQGNARGIARDAAIEDAQKRAVEQAIGILIDSQTRVENYQLISDRILSKTKGYIKRYTVTGETVDSSLLRVTINAEVALSRLIDDLTGIGILLGQLHKPRTMVLIAEQNIGNEWYGWWWDGSGQQTDMSIVEKAFMDKFTKKGIEFIEPQVASKRLRVSAAYRVPYLTAVQARELGNQFGAEVVITGKAMAKLYGVIGGGMKSVETDLTARAVRIDTGQVIAAVTTHAAAEHMSEITAGTDALRKAANQAADELIVKILAVYSKKTGTRPVNITITGLNKAEFEKFKDVLRNQVRSIKDLHERSFKGTTARISVDSKVGALALSHDLSHRDFGTFAVEVIGSTASSLELKVTLK